MFPQMAGETEAEEAVEDAERWEACLVVSVDGWKQVTASGSIIEVARRQEKGDQMDYEIYEKIAAEMFGGDPGLLNYKLSQHLREVAELTERVGGKLRSRQVIATLIANWSMRNPDAMPYGE